MSIYKKVFYLSRFNRTWLIKEDKHKNKIKDVVCNLVIEDDNGDVVITIYLIYVGNLIINEKWKRV